VITGMPLALVAGLTLTAAAAFAGEAEVFDLGKELSGAGQGRRSVSLSLVKTPEYTVNAVAVNDEIPPTGTTTGATCSTS